ncbi:MAG: hypothetical protein RR651_08570 [Lysinibacillus sp.]
MKRRGDDWWIVWLIYLFSPIILLFGLLFLVKGLNLLVAYIEFIQNISGFEDQSFMLLISIGIPPIVILYILVRLFEKLEKKLKDQAHK